MLPLPLWPPETNPFFANAKAIYTAFREVGFLSIPASLGMLANIEAESACEITAAGDQVNGQPTAFGLCQWHGARIAAIKAGTGIDIMSFPSIEDQCRAALWELKSIPALGGDEIIVALTSRSAGIAACTYFERAGAADAAERRGAMAERWSAYASVNKWGR